MRYLTKSLRVVKKRTKGFSIVDENEQKMTETGSRKGNLFQFVNEVVNISGDQKTVEKKLC